MTRGQWFAHGSCLLCGCLFAFDPERGVLPSLATPRWATGPDLSALHHRGRQPERCRRGLPEFPILPGAYLDQ
jgi:hypothetical protein